MSGDALDQSGHAKPIGYADWWFEQVWLIEHNTNLSSPESCVNPIFSLSDDFSPVTLYPEKLVKCHGRQDQIGVTLRAKRRSLDMENTVKAK